MVSGAGFQEQLNSLLNQSCRIVAPPRTISEDRNLVSSQGRAEMTPHAARRGWPNLPIALCLMFLPIDHARAQGPRPATGRSVSPSAASGTPSSTIVEIKLISSPDGGALHSQQWVKFLEPLDVTVQIQQSTGTEKPGMREREVGALRYVTVVGTLDRAGRASLGGRTFELSDGAKLREWITELKTYGVQGTPEGQPMWGLTKAQFNQFYDNLLKPAEKDARDIPVRQAVSELPIPAQYSVRWTQAANELLKRPGARTRARQDVRGFSAATALAVALNDCGLGFRPNRTPTGGLEISIEPLGECKDQWPVGWPMQQQRLKAAPKFFALTSIELNQVNLTDLLPTITELTDIPILIDYHEIEQKKIDLDKTTVSFKKGQATWSRALKNMVVPKKLSPEIWQDEAGKTFVWLTTNRPGRSGQPPE